VNFPVTLEIKPSRRLRAALCFMHAAAFFSVIAAVSDAGELAFVAAGLAWSLWNVLRCQVPVCWRLGSDGQLGRAVANSEAVPAAILPGIVVLHWLIVIRVRCQDESSARRIVVLADSVGEREFRMFRLWLRWQARFSASAEPA